MGAGDNGTDSGSTGEAPKRFKRRWYKLGKETSFLLSAETLVAIVLGTLAVGGVWYAFKARADTMEVRVQSLEGTDERLERVYEKAIETVQLSQVTIAATQAEVAGLKKEREEDRAEREADRRQNKADHDAILGEIRLLARSKEPR